LNEEIEGKVKELSKKINEGEWTEVEMDEELKGGQKKIDVAEPKGKITAADFKKLRDAKSHKEEVEEWFFFDDEEEDESIPGDYEGDEEEEEEAEELSAQEPTYVGKGLGKNSWDVSRKPKMMGSFDDEHGWYDEIDRPSHPDALDDYDEEEFPDFQSLMSKHGKNQRWFAKDGERYFKLYQDKFGGKPFRVRSPKFMDEAETEEGNAFSGALAHAKESGKDSFEVDGKKYQVKETRDKFDGRKSKVIGVYSNIKKQREMKEDDDKWIQKTGMKKGALHKKLGIPEEDKIPQSKLKSLKKELMKKGEGDKKLSAADSKLLKQVNLALTLKSVKESVNTLRLTEDELIDMIEKIVIEQKVKDSAETSNIAKKEAEGLKKTNKVLDLDKKENDDYAKEVVTKMKDYMKDMFMGGKGYNENPDDFPQSNYDMEKEHNEMKYHPSDAVEEYIEAFAYPGMTNLVYDEIKPDDEMITKQIKGDVKNGNAITDKDGKALGNVSKRSEKVGDRFKKNFDDNLYGAEQMEVSYNRQPQPVDVAGSKKQAGSLKSIKSTSAGKANKIMSQLESIEDKKSKIVSEEMSKMKNLISYDRKTQ
jgi:hypothetical protein